MAQVIKLRSYLPFKVFYDSFYDKLELTVQWKLSGAPGKWLWEVAPPRWAIRALSWDAGAVPIMSLCCPPVTERRVGWGHAQGSEWRAFRALGRAGAGIQMLHIRKEPCSRSPPSAVCGSEWCLSQPDPAVCLVKNGWSWWLLSVLVFLVCLVGLSCLFFVLFWLFDSVNWSHTKQSSIDPYG